MTTQRDLDTAAEVSLEICAQCGWYEGWNHKERCNPANGKAAAALIAAVPEVTSGQLGYGDGNVVFDLAADFCIVFEKNPNAFTLRSVHLLENLSVEEAASLVRALNRWGLDVAVKRMLAAK